MREKKAFILINKQTPILLQLCFGTAWRRVYRFHDMGQKLEIVLNLEILTFFCHAIAYVNSARILETFTLKGVTLVLLFGRQAVC